MQVCHQIKLHMTFKTKVQLKLSFEIKQTKIYYRAREELSIFFFDSQCHSFKYGQSFIISDTLINTSQTSKIAQVRRIICLGELNQAGTLFSNLFELTYISYFVLEELKSFAYISESLNDSQILSFS